jgi:hypothetical protein
MIKLGVTYKKNGYLFELHKRDENVAIYKQINEKSNRFIAFEVLRMIWMFHFTGLSTMR